MCLAIIVVKKIVHYTKDFSIWSLFLLMFNCISIHILFVLHYFCYINQKLPIFNSINFNLLVSNFNFVAATQSIFVI